MRQVRQVKPGDFVAMHRIRLAVRENQLTRTVVEESDYLRETAVTGRGWLMEENGEVLGFAIGNRETGNIWALFVHPDHEGQGIGSVLHDTMLIWLRAQGLPRLTLSTDSGTRAERFYLAKGWVKTGSNEFGEMRFEFTFLH